MLSIIVTWIGTVLGMAVLLAMALGAFVVDIDDALDRRRDSRALRHRTADATPEESAASA